MAAFTAACALPSPSFVAAAISESVPRAPVFSSSFLELLAKSILALTSLTLLLYVAIAEFASPTAVSAASTDLSTAVMSIAFFPISVSARACAALATVSAFVAACSALPAYVAAFAAASAAAFAAVSAFPASS